MALLSTPTISEKGLLGRLSDIETEKTDNLLPENIKSNVKVLNVLGTLEEVNNQTAEITENGTYTPDDGYTGFDEVTVNVTPTVTNQDITITENGTYTADEGYDGLGTVKVNVTPSDTWVVDSLNYGFYSSSTATSYQNLFLQFYDEIMSKFDLSSITSLNMASFLYNNTTLTDVDLSLYLPENLSLAMSGCFYANSALTTVTLPANCTITNAYQLFQNCTTLTTINDNGATLATSSGYSSGYNTNATRDMFYNATLITTQPNFTKSLTNLGAYRMFYYSYVSGDITVDFTFIDSGSSGNTLISNDYMCASMRTTDPMTITLTGSLTGTTDSSVTVIDIMRICSNNTTVTSVDTSGLDVPFIKSWTSSDGYTYYASGQLLYQSFYKCTALTTVDISNFDFTEMDNYWTYLEGRGETGEYSSKYDLFYQSFAYNAFYNCTALQTVYVKDSTAKSYIDYVLTQSGLSIGSTIKD